MRALTIHEKVQGGVAASTCSIWLAHVFAPELEWLASIAVAIIAAVSVDVEHSLFRWRQWRERCEHEAESEL
jgi:membrane protein YdbS with pleckstrin-like domain